MLLTAPNTAAKLGMKKKSQEHNTGSKLILQRDNEGYQKMQQRMMPGRSKRTRQR
jgi:hypothetical protein